MKRASWRAGESFSPPIERSLGEAFIYGDFEIEGDIIAAFSLYDALRKRTFSTGDLLSLARDLGVNIAGIGIILNMRERMEQMQQQMQEFVKYVQEEVLSRAQQAAPNEGLVPVRRPVVIPPGTSTVMSDGKKK